MTDKLVEDVAKAIEEYADGLVSSYSADHISIHSVAIAQAAITATGVLEIREALEICKEGYLGLINLGVLSGKWREADLSKIKMAERVLSNTHEPEKVETDGIN